MDISRLSLNLLVKIIFINTLSFFTAIYVLKFFGCEFSSFLIFVVLLSGILIDIHFKTRKPVKTFFRNGVCTITNKAEDCDEDCISCTISMKYK